MAFRDTRRFDSFAVVEVRSTARISPHFVRVTVGGEALAAWPVHGFDQWFRLYLPEPGRTSFELPEPAGTIGRLDFLRSPSTQRAQPRNYTVRTLRPEAREIDIDFVIHDHGAASDWAQCTRPGDQVALLDQARGYDPSPDPAAHVLLVSDETGLPAVAGILRDLPRDARGEAFLELSDPADRQELDPPDGVAVHWLVRGPGARPGALVLGTVTGWTPPGSNVWAYLVGERTIPTGIRRWLINDHQVNRAAISFVGYWRIA